MAIVWLIFKEVVVVGEGVLSIWRELGLGIIRKFFIKVLLFFKVWVFIFVGLGRILFVVIFGINFCKFCIKVVLLKE